jgi:hypothetical protein
MSGFPNTSLSGSTPKPKPVGIVLKTRYNLLL